MSAVSGSCCTGGLGMIGSGNKCTITNRAFNESLYATACACVENYNKERRHVFTWIPGGCGDECNWKIETIHTNCGYKFKLKNLNLDEYFYAATDDLKYDKERRNVFSWIPKTTCDNQCYWEIKSLNNGTGYVTIKNTEYNEYLYAAAADLKYDCHRRRVFTWKYSDDDVANGLDWQSHWNIRCN